MDSFRKSWLRFRISSLLFVMLVFAVSLGWYIDRPNRTQERILGSWEHPYSGSGYWETLAFDEQGHFERHVRHRFGADRFVGEYKIDSDDYVHFFFERRSTSDGRMRALTDEEQELADCIARCAFDDRGNLLIVNLDSDVAYGDCRPKNECYIPSRNYNDGRQRHLAVDELLDVLK